MSSACPSFNPGDKLPACEIAISQELINAYASISGDFNPIHVDAQAGARSVFGSTVAHGCLPMEPLFQSLLRWCASESLPQRTEMNFRYRAPSRPGDVIRSDAQVAGSSVADGRTIVEIAFVCANQRGEPVLDGVCRIPLGTA